MQTWYFLSVPATSHERRGSTPDAFPSLTHNIGSTARRGRNGNLLLLCVAEQYRGAVEPSETEGLRKINMGNYHIYNDVT
ncbi:MAG: hypothetical protein E7084_07645 [Bacteroidales bacterium]|nr:hypothetical protein [Bacteroidales bacterium]